MSHGQCDGFSNVRERKCIRVDAGDDRCNPTMAAVVEIALREMARRSNPFTSIPPDVSDAIMKLPT